MRPVAPPVVRWVILRRNPESMPDEPLAVLDDRAEAGRLCDELGPGHDVQPVDAVAPDQVRVVQMWTCRATLRDGYTPDIAEPVLMQGASQLVPIDAPMPWRERVAVDDEASELEAMVDGRRARYLTAYADSAQRARALVRAEAERLAGQE